MILWLPDRTGRFRRRPYFDLNELNRRCERVVEQFSHRLYGQEAVSVPTGMLVKLIEKHAVHLELYTDLSSEGEGVEGVTYFYTGKRPLVRISRELFENRLRIHRLRHTLAHEYAHVRLHAPAWRRRWLAHEQLQKCHGDHILSLNGKFDWMEWQASYPAAPCLCLRAASVGWSNTISAAGRSTESPPTRGAAKT
jgi:hypothetical protein